MHKPLIHRVVAAACLTVLATSTAIAQDVGPAPKQFMKWEMIELPVSTGAACSNGSPYRFFVNRSTHATNKNNTVVVFEGGGACWDQNACQGFLKGGLLAAANVNGIPENYMSGLSGLSFFGWVTPFTSRNHPLQKIQTQSWNIVYAPYCTGDVHSGNQAAVYTDVDPKKPLAYLHKGGVNGEAMAAWLGKYMAKPDKLLVTGFSAGGAGATSHYGWVRLAMQPKQSALLADSGPLFPAPRNGSPDVYPSVPLQNKVRSAWGVDGPNGMATRLIQRFPTAGTVDDLGTITTGIAKVFPQDRLGYAAFQRDGIYSDFSYSKFYPEINAASGDARKAMLHARWDKDVKNWVNAMKEQPNIGYYLPWERNFLESHTLTIASFANTDIKEANLASVGVFLDNLLDPTQPLIRAVESPQK